MDSSEGQILDRREKAHSLVFLLFVAKEKKNSNGRITDKIRHILKFSHTQQNWFFYPMNVQF